MSNTVLKQKKKKKKKEVLSFHANCLQWRQLEWNVKSCFLGKQLKKKKNHQCVVCWISLANGKCAACNWYYCPIVDRFQQQTRPRPIFLLQKNENKIIISWRQTNLDYHILAWNNISVQCTVKLQWLEHRCLVSPQLIRTRFWEPRKFYR